MSKACCLRAPITWEEPFGLLKKEMGALYRTPIVVQVYKGMS